jgi:hypothetical protein
MSYFADLTPYTYLRADDEYLNVGWLAAGRSFLTGDTLEGFMDALVVSAREYHAKMRGFQNCVFCDLKAPIWVSSPGETEDLLLGMSEIRVAGEGDRKYAAPSLIVHYVANHHYCPPLEFQRAVLAAVDPKTAQTA